MPVTDSRVLFRLGKRYRGFVNTARGAVPVTFNVYPLTPEEVRLKHLFPTNIAEHLEKGSADVLSPRGWTLSPRTEGSSPEFG